MDLFNQIQQFKRMYRSTSFQLDLICEIRNIRLMDLFLFSKKTKSYRDTCLRFAIEYRVVLWMSPF